MLYLAGVGGSCALRRGGDVQLAAMLVSAVVVVLLAVAFVANIAVCVAVIPRFVLTAVGCSGHPPLGHIVGRVVGRIVVFGRSIVFPGTASPESI